MPPLGRRCLVTGATGAIGPRLLERLVDEGWKVRVLVRHPREDMGGCRGAEIVEGTITDPDAVRRAVAGTDIVYHLAAFLHVTDPTPALHSRYREVNVDGTRHVVEAATREGTQRVVFFSTIAVYGYARRQAFREEDACVPETPYGETKLEAERLVLAATRQDGTPLGVVLRLAAVYGPGTRGNYERLARAIARGRFVAIGAGENRRALVHDRDVAGAALLAAAHPDAAGCVFNVSDGREHRLRAIVSAIAAAAGREVPRAYVPLGMARALARMAEAGARLVGATSPVTRATIDKYVEDVVVDSSRIRRGLGFVPRVGLQEGWLDAVAGMRARGVL